MVRRLDADHARFERAVVLVEVAEEVKLRLGRPHEEDLTVAMEDPRDLPKVLVLVVGVVSDAQVDLVRVAVGVRAGCIDCRRSELVGVDLDDAGLFVVNPDDGVLHDELSSMRVGT
jgi:hypothetical protein